MSYLDALERINDQPAQCGLSQPPSFRPAIKQKKFVRPPIPKAANKPLQRKRVDKPTPAVTRSVIAKTHGTPQETLEEPAAPKQTTTTGISARPLVDHNNLAPENSLPGIAQHKVVRQKTQVGDECEIQPRDVGPSRAVPASQAAQVIEPPAKAAHGGKRSRDATGGDAQASGQQPRPPSKRGSGQPVAPVKGVLFTKRPPKKAAVQSTAESNSLRSLIRTQQANERKQAALKAAASAGATAGEGAGDVEVIAQQIMPERDKRAGHHVPKITNKANEGNAGGGAVVAPQVQLDSSGNIIINQSTLVVAAQPKEQQYMRVDDSNRFINSMSFRQGSCKPQQWTTEETNMFYKHLRHYGTQFSLIANFYPTRTPKQLKTKYLREYKLDKERVENAIHKHSQQRHNVKYYKQVLDLLEEQEEQAQVPKALPAPPTLDPAHQVHMSPAVPGSLPTPQYKPGGNNLPTPAIGTPAVGGASPPIGGQTPGYGAYHEDGMGFNYQGQSVYGEHYQWDGEEEYY